MNTALNTNENEGNIPLLYLPHSLCLDSLSIYGKFYCWSRSLKSQNGCLPKSDRHTRSEVLVYGNKYSIRLVWLIYLLLPPCKNCDLDVSKILIMQKSANPQMEFTKDKIVAKLRNGYIVRCCGEVTVEDSPSLEGPDRWVLVKIQVNHSFEIWWELPTHPTFLCRMC